MDENTIAVNIRRLREKKRNCSCSNSEKYGIDRIVKMHKHTTALEMLAGYIYAFLRFLIKNID